MTTIIGTGEVGALHSREELEEMQRLPLQRKIQITTARIIEWYQHYDGKVYVAFSGGKDSTVLLDIVRRIYPDVPAVFSDTGLEFPEVREFVKSCENVTIVRPEMNFRKVIEVYGYPVVSKRVANTVEYGHIACDRDIVNKQNNERETDFFDVTAWRSTADFVGKYFGKGRMIVVVGRLQKRNYTDKDGNKRSAVDIIAENVYFGDSKKDGETSDNASASTTGYATAPSQNSDFANVGEEDGELPF